MPYVAPTTDELRIVANRIFNLRGGAHGFDQADWYMAERAIRFDRHYERVFIHHIASTTTHYLGDAAAVACRFCTSAGQTFNTEPHAVPTLLGNRRLLSHYECDACNQIFGHLESHLGSFTNATRAALGVMGRRRVPSAVSDGQRSRVDFIGGQLNISNYLSDPIANLDHANRTVTITLPSAPFYPIAVYKAFLKSALTVCPAAELGHFTEWIDFVRDQNHAASTGYTEARLFVQLVSAPVPDDFYWVELFRRRDNTDRVPYMAFVVTMGSVVFQIPVFSLLLDGFLAGQPFSIPRYPAGIGLGYQNGEPAFRNYDLNVATTVRAPTEITLGFGSAART